VRNPFKVQWYFGENRLTERTFATQAAALSAIKEKAARAITLFVAVGPHGERWMKIGDY
jgi:hypothetical protein